MFELLLTIFTGGGAVGLGSIFKMISGFADSYSHRKELREHRKILQNSQDASATLAFQKEAFGDTDGGLFARHTRRMLALIGVSTLAVVTIHCVLFPYDAFVTLPSVASAGEGGHCSFFCLITIPRSNIPILLTLVHLALRNFTSIQLILRFYFAVR